MIVIIIPPPPSKKKRKQQRQKRQQGKKTKKKSNVRCSAMQVKWSERGKKNIKKKQETQEQEE